MREIEEMKEKLRTELARLRKIVHAEHDIPGDPVIDCHHVEHVKTYAPGVMHCVFDIQVAPFEASLGLAE
jgi:tRNA wybutosine-synthesizing protein 2